MPMSTDMRKAHAWALQWEDKWKQKYLRTGKAGHPGFDGLVTLVCDDGTTYTYFDAFAAKYQPPHCDTEFVVVFTEHHGFHIEAEDDLLHYSQWEQRTSIPSYDFHHQELSDD